MKPFDSLLLILFSINLLTMISCKSGTGESNGLDGEFTEDTLYEPINEDPEIQEEREKELTIAKESSSFKDLSCDEILKELERKLSKAKTEVEKNGVLSEFSNDPNIAKCKTQESFRDSLDEIEEKYLK